MGRRSRWVRRCAGPCRPAADFQIRRSGETWAPSSWRPPSWKAFFLDAFFFAALLLGRLLGRRLALALVLGLLGRGGLLPRAAALHGRAPRRRTRRRRPRRPPSPSSETIREVGRAACERALQSHGSPSSPSPSDGEDRGRGAGRTEARSLLSACKNSSRSGIPAGLVGGLLGRSALPRRPPRCAARPRRGCSLLAPGSPFVGGFGFSRAQDRPSSPSCVSSLALLTRLTSKSSNSSSTSDPRPRGRRRRRSPRRCHRGRPLSDQSAS